MKVKTITPQFCMDAQISHQLFSKLWDMTPVKETKPKITKAAKKRGEGRIGSGNDSDGEDQPARGNRKEARTAARRKFGQRLAARRQSTRQRVSRLMSEKSENRSSTGTAAPIWKRVSKLVHMKSELIDQDETDDGSSSFLLAQRGANQNSSQGFPKADGLPPVGSASPKYALQTSADFEGPQFVASVKSLSSVKELPETLHGESDEGVARAKNMLTQVLHPHPGAKGPGKGMPKVKGAPTGGEATLATDTVKSAVSNPEMSRPLLQARQDSSPRQCG
jgi:hypothetical protein